MSRAFIKAFDYLFLTRPVLFLPIWTIFLAGLINPHRDFQDDLFSQWLNIQENLFKVEFWLTFASLSMLMGAVFIINQLYDIDSDRQNNKLFLIPDGLITKREAILESLVLLILAFITAFQKDLTFVFLGLMLFLITGLGYSIPPFSWKDKPVAGLIVNLVGGLLTFLVGWQLYAVPEGSAFKASLPYLMGICGVYLLTTIADKAGDEMAGKMTFAVRFGVKKTVSTALIFEVFCVLFAFIARDYFILLPALAAIPFFIRSILKRELDSIAQASRIGILSLSIAVTIYFPAYLVLMVLIFLLSKWYYRHRFHLNYPTLLPVSTKD